MDTEDLSFFLKVQESILNLTAAISKSGDDIKLIKDILFELKDDIAEIKIRLDTRYKDVEDMKDLATGMSKSIDILLVQADMRETEKLRKQMLEEKDNKKEKESQPEAKESKDDGVKATVIEFVLNAIKDIFVKYWHVILTAITSTGAGAFLWNVVEHLQKKP